MLWIKPSGIKIETNDRKETIKKCVEMGWEPDKDEIEGSQGDSKKSQNDGDKGSGEFNSIEWHRSAIIAMESKEEVAEYLSEVNGKSLDKRLSLESAKQKAIQLIEAE